MPMICGFCFCLEEAEGRDCVEGPGEGREDMMGGGIKVGPSLGQLAVLSISGVLHISGLALSPPSIVR